MEMHREIAWFAHLYLCFVCRVGWFLTLEWTRSAILLQMLLYVSTSESHGLVGLEVQHLWKTCR